MQVDLQCLSLEPGIVEVVLRDVKEAPFAGFPVVRQPSVSSLSVVNWRPISVFATGLWYGKVKSSEDLSVVGYVLAKPLQQYLEAEIASSRCWAI